MLKSIKQRLDREDEGFTLIELMVVLLIIAILLAIAIPTFLGARNTANARSTQENLRNALTAEQTTWTNTQAFDNVTTDMASIEPSLTWSNATTATEGGNTVTVTANGNQVELQGYAKNGNCYAIFQDNGASGSETGYSVSTGACTAPSALAAITVNPGNAGSNTSGAWYTSW